MKKTIFSVILMTFVMVLGSCSCGNGNTTEVQNDSIAVDSVVVDSVATVDTLSVDTIVVAD